MLIGTLQHASDFEYDDYVIPAQNPSISLVYDVATIRTGGAFGIVAERLACGCPVTVGGERQRDACRHNLQSKINKKFICNLRPSALMQLLDDFFCDASF